MNPILSLFTALRLLLAGRIHFPRGRVGETLLLEDGLSWTIFRQVVIDPSPPAQPGLPTGPGAIFRARFHLAKMSLRQNIRFSRLPMLFILGLPGFRSKLWLYCAATGGFQGIYEWDTLTAAQAYGRSFAARFMTRRSIPGSVSLRALPRIQALQEMGLTSERVTQ